MPIPYRGDDPFPEEKYSFIIPGNTSKVTVIGELGNPSTCRLGDKIFIYARGQRDWMWVWGIAGPGAGGSGKIPTYLTHLLIIEFDKNDIVTAVEEFSGDSGELKSGLYVVNAGGYTTPSKTVKSESFFFTVETKRGWSFSDDQLILRASHNIDKQAKQFAVPPNKSAIYFYRKFADFFRARLDGILSVDPGSEGFIVWVVDPGEHYIGTSDPNSNNLTISCHPGEKHYIEHNKGVLEEKNKAIGETEISKRNLIIDRLDTLDLNSSEYPK